MNDLEVRIKELEKRMHEPFTTAINPIAIQIHELKELQKRPIA